MRRSVIVYAASLLVNTILLPSVSDAESFLDPIFKKLNYNVTPRTLVEYRKAFNDLAHYYIILDLNYQRLQDKNKLLKKELEAEKDEKNKVNSVLTIRENIENVERRINTEINYRSKPEMISILKNPEKKFYVNLTTEVKEEIKRLGTRKIKRIFYKYFVRFKMLKRSKIVLYTTLILGVVASMPRVSVTHSTTNEQNYLLSARLKELNYTEIPKSIASWRSLFLDLGHKYMMLENKYGVLENKYGVLDKNHQILIEKYNKLKNNTNKINSVLTVRSNIEDVEEHIDVELNFMRKKEMLKILKDKDTKFLITLTTSDRTEIVNQLGCEGYENVHFVKWLYFLLMSKCKMACDLRELLKNNTISEFHFCKAIGRIYEKVSSRIHDISIRITPALVREGLIMYGFTDESLLSCANVLPLLTSMTALYKGELSTLIPLPPTVKGNDNSEN